MVIKTLRDFNFKNKKVLVRCDFNVPLSWKGEINILDDFRIKKTLPTIHHLKKEGAKVILMSHLGRPSEEPENREKYSLKPIAQRLETFLKEKVKFLPDDIGERVKNEIEKMKEGEVILLENLRFYKEEEQNDLGFAKKLAALGDIYINDAFSASHRAHASISGICQFLPSGAGFLLEREVDTLTNLIKNSKKPLVGIIGGIKVETKARVIDRLSEIANFILIGGMISQEVKEKEIKFQNSQKVIHPVDMVGTFDIGPKTIKLFQEKIRGAKTIFWAGPLGKIEEKEYQKGSKAIARAIIKSGAFSVIGGGETVEFMNEVGLTSKFNFVSTGGGAMLEFLSGKKLPGIEALCSALASLDHNS